MVSMKVVRFPSKVPVHREYQLLCFRSMPMNMKANLRLLEVRPMYSCYIGCNK